MTNNKKNKKSLKSLNPFNNQETALEKLRKEYPSLPEPHLLRCWTVYMDQKKKSEKDRREFHDMLDNKPKCPKLSDFDNEDEIKGALVYNGEIEVEVELLDTIPRDVVVVDKPTIELIE